MKKIILFTLFSYFLIITNAQISQDSINRLKNDLQRATGVEKIIKFNHLAVYYYSVGKYDSSYYYDCATLSLSKKINYLKGIKASLSNMVEFEYYAGNYNTSLSNLFSLDSIYKIIKDTTLIMINYRKISITYKAAMNFEEQLRYEKKIRETCELYSIKDFPNNYYNNNFSGIGDAYQNLNQLDSALKYFNKDYEISLSNINGTDKYASLLNLGEVNYRLKNYLISLSYLKQVENSYFKTVPEFNIEISKCFYKLKMIDSSFFYANKAYSYSINITDNVSSSENLFTLYKEIGKIDSAFKYQNKYIESKENSLNTKATMNIQKMSMQQKINEEKLAEKIREEKKRRKENYRMSLIAIFIPTFIMTLYLITKKRKNNSKVIKLFGLASLLMVFEFISLLIHPIVEHNTNRDPVLMYLCLLIIAMLLAPLHSKLEAFVNKHFTNS